MTSALYVLDENLHSCYGENPESFYVNASKIVRCGTTDDLLLERASKRNLLIITNDIRFVLNTLTKKKDIVYENHDGERFYLPGKDVVLIDKNNRMDVIKWRNKREKRIIDFANRTPLCIPFYGFNMVSFF